MDFQALATEFVADLSEKGRSDSTVIAYKKDISQLGEYLSQQAGVKNISTVTPDLLQKYVDDLIKNNSVTLKTVSRKINSLRTFFKFLLASGKIKENPARAIQHPKSQPVTPRILTSLEYRSIRDVARTSQRHYTMIELLLQTGLRIGELSRLQRTDVIFNNDGKNYLNISGFSSLKSRKVELNQLVSQALKDYLEKSPASSLQTVQFLFFTKTGKPVLIRNIRTALNRIFKKAGIKNATVNDLRNTFIVYQLQNGIKLEKLAEIVGHKKPSTTERYLQFLETRSSKEHSKITPL
jgi:site-specific recombinase XerD